MTLLAVCHVHDISWDLDFDPPHVCDEKHDLLVFEDGCPANANGKCRPDYQNGVCFDCGLSAGPPTG